MPNSPEVEIAIDALAGRLNKKLERFIQEETRTGLGELKFEQELVRIRATMRVLALHLGSCEEILAGLTLAPYAELEAEIKEHMRVGAEKAKEYLNASNPH